MVTYRLLAPASKVNLFLVYFPRARLTYAKTSCHLVAPSLEAGLLYLNSDDVYETKEFNGWQVMPTTAAILDYLGSRQMRTTKKWDASARELSLLLWGRWGLVVMSLFFSFSLFFLMVILYAGLASLFF